MPLLWNAVINLNIVKQFNHILTNEFFQRKCIETTKYMDLCSINYFLYVYRCISSEYLDFIGFDDGDLFSHVYTSSWLVLKVSSGEKPFTH